MKKNTVKTLIIIGIVAGIIVFGLHAGGNLMEMIRLHMGI